MTRSSQRSRNRPDTGGHQHERSRPDTRGDEAAVAVKHAIARQIEREMKVQRVTKTMMAASMHTSRAALNRLLDRGDTGLTLLTLTTAAAVLGTKLRIELTRS